MAQEGKDAGVKWPAPLAVNRQKQGGLAPPVLDKVFRVDGKKLPAYVGVETPAGYSLVRVSKVIELEKVFGVPRFDWEHTSGIMVVVEAEGGRVALLVDELLGQQQVVVKNLESNYRKVNDVSGATIMGDGRVALILDVGSLVRRSRH